MITASMSTHEIANELRKDYSTVMDRTEYFVKSFGSAAKKTRLYPMHRFYEYTTPERKNKFIVTLVAKKRSQWKAPLVGIGAYWESPYGVAMAIFEHFPDVAGVVAIYTTHCISRFRERAEIAKDVSSLDLIKQLTISSPNMEMVHVSPQICHNIDNLEDEETFRYAAVCKAGVFFADVQHDKTEIIFKTFLPFSMLAEEQLEALQPQIDITMSKGLPSPESVINSRQCVRDIERLLIEDCQGTK